MASPARETESANGRPMSWGVSRPKAGHEGRAVGGFWRRDFRRWVWFLAGRAAGPGQSSGLSAWSC